MTPEEIDNYHKIFGDIIGELDRQLKKWGVQNHRPEKWIAIAGEEYGEACKAWLENKPEDYRREMVQVAAVCVHAIECLDRHQASVHQVSDGPWEHGIQRK